MMKELDKSEIILVVGGSDDGYDSGHKIGEALAELADAISDAIDAVEDWWDNL